MFSVSDSGIVYLNRGDSMRIPLFINMGTSLEPIQYLLSDADTLYFALMEPNETFERAILKKVFTNKDPLDEEGDVFIKLEPKDTEYLLPGRYYYTIKMKTDNEDGSYDVQTITPETEFQILR